MHEHHIFDEMGRDRHQRFVEDARHHQLSRRRIPRFLLLVGQVARLMSLLNR